MPQIACCQFQIDWENKSANYRTVEEMVRQAALSPGSMLIVPEMFATGFTMNAAKVVEQPGGATHQFLAALAKTHHLFVVGGVVQAGRSGRPRNEALAFSSEGELLARYAKMHPFSLGGETEHYTAGDEIVQFEWQGIRVTPFICYDLRFPELFRRAAKLGTDLFINIASWPGSRTHHWLTLLAARAIENQAYVVGNNRCGYDPGLTYQGRSVIVDYSGTVLADAGEQPGVARAELDLASLRQYRQKLPFLKDRRSDL